MKAEHPVPVLCATLEVSPSGYYAWRKRRACPGPRARENQALAQTVIALHVHSRHTYGSPRIVMALRHQGRRHGRNRVARLLRLAGLCGRQRRRYRPRTTDSNHSEPVAPNRLALAPQPTGPNQLWAGDITYIATRQGWLYLAAVLDLHSRKIVGWAMSERIDTALVLQALRMALVQRGQPAGVLFHSDRGVQYASQAFRHALAQAQLTPSMSRKGNCYDNAAVESFWSTLKLELVYRSEFLSHAHARAQLFDYLEVFYNRQRAHSALDYHSPVDFESLHP